MRTGIIENSNATIAEIKKKHLDWFFKQFYYENMYGIWVCENEKEMNELKKFIITCSRFVDTKPDLSKENFHSRRELTSDYKTLYKSIITNIDKIVKNELEINA
jgi:hypothetical protein